MTTNPEILQFTQTFTAEEVNRLPNTYLHNMAAEHAASALARTIIEQACAVVEVRKGDHFPKGHPGRDNGQLEIRHLVAVVKPRDEIARFAAAIALAESNAFTRAAAGLEDLVRKIPPQDLPGVIYRYVAELRRAAKAALPDEQWRPMWSFRPGFNDRGHYFLFDDGEIRDRQVWRVPIRQPDKPLSAEPPEIQTIAQEELHAIAWRPA